MLFSANFAQARLPELPYDWLHLLLSKSKTAAGLILSTLQDGKQRRDRHL